MSTFFTADDYMCVASSAVSPPRTAGNDVYPPLTPMRRYRQATCPSVSPLRATGDALYPYFLAGAIRTTGMLFRVLSCSSCLPVRTARSSVRTVRTGPGTVWWLRSGQTSDHLYPRNAAASSPYFVVCCRVSELLDVLVVVLYSQVVKASSRFTATIPFRSEDFPGVPAVEGCTPLKFSSSSPCFLSVLSATRPLAQNRRI